MPFRINNKVKWSTWSVNWFLQVLRDRDWAIVLYHSFCFISSFLFLIQLMCPLKNDFLLCAVITCFCVIFSSQKPTSYMLQSFYLFFLALLSLLFIAKEIIEAEYRVYFSFTLFALSLVFDMVWRESDVI